MRDELPRGYWNPVTETMPRDELKALQWRKLQALLRHVYAGSPLYRRRMDESGCQPDRVASLDDYLQRLRKLAKQFDDTMENMRKGMRDHLMPPKFLLEKVATQAAGVAALIVSQYGQPQLSPDALESRLEGSAVLSVVSS